MSKIKIKGFLQSKTAVSMRHCYVIFATSFLQRPFCNVIFAMAFRFAESSNAIDVTNHKLLLKAHRFTLGAHGKPYFEH